MRRLAILFAFLATTHIAETLVTPERVTWAGTVVGRVAVLLRTVWSTWRRDLWNFPLRRLGTN